MEENAEALISIFPAEVLQIIFNLLTFTQLIRCRRVCSWWMQTVDDMVKHDELWQKSCITDFKSMYKEARRKSSPNLSWRDLYVSLSFWRKWATAKESWGEISPTKEDRVIDTLHAWKGNVAVHEKDCVIYYDPQTLEQTNKFDIGDYITFDETDDVIVYLYYYTLNFNGVVQISCNRQLRIVPKRQNEVLFDKMITRDNVNHFAIFRDKIIYNSWTYDPMNRNRCLNVMYQCNLSDFEFSVLSPIVESVYFFGCTDERLAYVSCKGRIFTYVGDRFKISDSVNNKDGFFKLCKYNLTANANFNKEVMDTYGMTSRSPCLPEAMRVYGNMSFIGTLTGVLKVYDSLSLLIDKDTEPLREYDLNTVFNLPDTKIRAIDVLEKERGHSILITTCNKVVILTLSHD